MRIISKYSCELCGKEYTRVIDAHKCEAKCLGLSLDDYILFMQLLDEKKCTFRILSYTNNDQTRARANKATENVIEFINNHNLKCALPRNW